MTDRSPQDERHDPNALISGGGAGEGDRRPDVRTELPLAPDAPTRTEGGGVADGPVRGPGSGPAATGAGARYTGTMPDDPEEARHYRPERPVETPYADDQDQFLDRAPSLHQAQRGHSGDGSATDADER